MNSLRQKILILGGIFLLLSGYLFYLRTNTHRLNFSSLPQTKAEQSGVLPIGIVISAINISLPVFPAQYSNNIWETTDKGISYLTSSPLPGEKGNSILYGHNWTNLLGKLTTIKPGDEIIVLDQKGKFVTFKVSYTATIDPTDVSILAQSNDSRITIYTCTGFLDTKRFVAVAQKTT